MLLWEMCSLYFRVDVVFHDNRKLRLPAGDVLLLDNIHRGQHVSVEIWEKGYYDQARIKKCDRLDWLQLWLFILRSDNPIACVVWMDSMHSVCCPAGAGAFQKIYARGLVYSLSAVGISGGHDWGQHADVSFSMPMPNRWYHTVN